MGLSTSRSTLHVYSVEELGITILFLVLTATQQIWGQTSPTSERSVYEGHNVSTVALIANPHRDVEALRSLIVQKSGQPFSSLDVGRSITALEHQGGCSNVQLEVASTSLGLQLTFVLERPYYVGVLEFPRLAKHFSYPQLLRAVEFSDQEPYSKTRLPTAEAELQKYFHTFGYFRAQVRAEPTIDDKDEIVNITFSVELGERARIRNVAIQGVSDAQALQLLGILRSKRARFAGAQVKPGKFYTADLEKDAAAFLKKRLAGKRLLASKVESIVQYDAAFNVVDLAFDVELGATVSVRVTGARLSRIPFASARHAKKLIPIYSEHSFDDDLIEEGRRNLTDHFRRKGYFDVDVKTKLTRSADHITLNYDIQRGEKHRLDRIIWKGTQQISQKDLLGQLSIAQSSFWSRGRFSDTLLQQSADNLKALYQDSGYEQVKVTWRTHDHEPRLDAIFEIEEGPQSVVDKVLLKGNDHLSQDQLTGSQGLQLQAGTPFSRRGLSADRNHLSASYLNHGYLNAQVMASVYQHPDDPQRVDVTYTILEGPLVRISRVAYLGHQRTQASLLNRTTLLKPEVPMKRVDLLAAESRLYALNIFDWSSVGPKKPIAYQNDEAALVKVHEARRNEITYGFGFDVAHRGGNVPGGSVAVPGIPPVSLEGHEIAPSESTYVGPRGSIELSRKNIRGMAETASALLLLSRLDQQVMFTYNQPRFAGTDWSSLTSFVVERTTENPLFAAGLGNLSFQVEHLLKRPSKSRLQLRYNLNRTNLWDLLVPELVLPQDRNVRLSTISGTLIRETRDKTLDAHRGSFTTLNMALTSSALGSTASFAKLFGQYAFYKSAGSVVFANSVRLGLAKAITGSFVPTSELFFSGGGTSLRSFPINQAGPQRIVPFCNVLEGESGCVDVTVPLGGRQLVILNSEVRFPLGITKPLGGVIFYDGGNVYRAINLNDLVRNYTNTVGFGLRYATPIGPVRIDVGHNLNPVPGIHSTQYYITIGQAF